MSTLPEGEDEHRGSGEITISSTVVGICGLTFGLACLLALVVVVSVRGANPLSVVATTIALLAFIVQFQMFNHHSKLSAEQTRRNEEINADIRAFMAEIRVAATVAGQSVGRTESQSVRFSLPPKDRLRGRALARSEARRLFATFPDRSVGSAVLTDLSTLGLEQRQRIRELAADERQMLGEASTGTLGLPWAPADEALAALGLAAPAEIELQGASCPVSRLTDRGRNLACLLLAPGEPPAYAAAVLAGIPHGPLGTVTSSSAAAPNRAVKEARRAGRSR